MKTKIEIKSIWGSILFSFEKEDNTLKSTVIEAISSGADLRSVDLRSANLSGADLRSADLSGADLRSANLSGVDLNENTGFLLSQCPSEGSFIAWEKARGRIIKLQICEDAKRSSATTLKCRCSSALVLEIQNINGEKLEQKSISSDSEEDLIYEVGKISSVDDFDEDRFNERASGIHFFIAREMAVKF